MHRKALIALALIVLLPLAVLAWLGWQLISNEQQVLEHRLRSLVDLQLQAVDNQLADYFFAVQEELLNNAATLGLDSESIRAYTRASPRVRQVFLMSSDGERLHPPQNAVLTVNETRFLQRSADIWADKAILYQSGGRLPPQQVLNVQQDANNPDLEQPPYGWYVWHWGAESNLIFWQREQQYLLGFELEPVRVMADLINRLPTSELSDELNDEYAQARVRLLDDRGAVLYQWGGFQPEPQQTAWAIRPLSHPLGSWKLAYFAPPFNLSAYQFWFLIAAVLCVLMLVITGLAYYLYREHSRQVRQAQQRVNFVNQVSHELKTPLTNIRMYAELLDEQLLEDEAQPRRYLGVIVSESQRLSRLIANVLNFAGLQKDRLHVHLRSGCVDQVVNSVLAVLGPSLAAKNIAVHVQADAAAPVILDPDLIEQMLNNLLSNVEKYAASGGRVDINTWQNNSHSFIQVRDYGPGIAKREQARVFQPFYRVSSKLSDGVAGTGIGLTITRELARLHGGTLHLQPSGQGACFQLVLQTEPSQEKAKAL